MIHKKLKITVLGKGEDQEGRITFLKCIHNAKKMAFINVPAPNSYDLKFVDALNTILLELSEFQLVIGTDMNAILGTNLIRPTTIYRQPRFSNMYSLFTTSLMLGELIALKQKSTLSIQTGTKHSPKSISYSYLLLYLIESRK